MLPKENMPKKSRAANYEKQNCANLTIAQKADLSGGWTGSGLKNSNFEANYSDLRIRTLENQIKKYKSILVKKRLASRERDRSVQKSQQTVIKAF